MARKFIITETRMLMGNVEFHKDLLPKRERKPSYGMTPMNSVFNKTEESVETAKGGGRWHPDPEKKILYMWGASADFGPCTKEELMDAIASQDTWISAFMKDWDIYFSQYISDTLPFHEKFTFLMKVPD